MQKTKVLLVFGGESSEHEVSITSASNVFKAIDSHKYEVIPVFIDKSGVWWLLESFGQYSEPAKAQELAPMLGSGAFMTQNTQDVIHPDVMLPILHGKNGEDGSVQGLAQLLPVPIVGCGITSSAICINKVVTKEILSSHGIPIVSYLVHKDGELIPTEPQLGNNITLPVFVKPACSGSSVGVSKVTDEAKLQEAINVAHQHDSVALIEKAMVARELEVAVLGNVPGHQASTVGEIVPDGEFYSYESKYDSNSASQVIIPAEIDESLAEKVQDLAEQTYDVLGCQGLARIDFFLTSDDQVYVNEVNTMPGFTDISMYPKLWSHDGLEYPDLIDRLIQLALK